VALTVDADDATLANIVEALQPDIRSCTARKPWRRLVTSSRHSYCRS